MKNYSYLQTIYYSLFSRRLYRQVCQKWEGVGFLYIAFALLLMLILPVSVGTYKLSQITKDAANINRYKDRVLFGTDLTLEPVIQFIEQFPAIRVEGGKAYADVAQPYYLYISTLSQKGKQSPFLVVDTTGDTQSTAETGASMLITANHLITREEDGSEKKRLSFSQIQDMVIDRQMLYKWLSWQPLIYFPGMLAVYFIVYCINALVFGLLGYGLCRYLKLDYYYRDNIRLAAVTSTPVIILEMLSTLFSMQLFAKPSLVYILTHAMYMYHAVESNKKKYK